MVTATLQEITQRPAPLAAPLNRDEVIVVVGRTSAAGADVPAIMSSTLVHPPPSEAE